MKNQVIVCTVVILTLLPVPIMIGCRQQPATTLAPSTSPAMEIAVEHNDRGTALVKEGQLEQAILEFSQAIGLDSNYALAYSNRGWAYNETGQYDLAIADLDKAIALDPSH